MMLVRLIFIIILVYYSQQVRSTRHHYVDHDEYQDNYDDDSNIYVEKRNDYDDNDYGLYEIYDDYEDRHEDENELREEELLRKFRKEILKKIILQKREEYLKHSKMRHDIKSKLKPISKFDSTKPKSPKFKLASSDTQVENHRNNLHITVNKNENRDVSAVLNDLDKSDINDNDRIAITDDNLGRLDSANLAKQESANNIGVATITEDDSISVKDQLVSDLDAASVFLEPNVVIAQNYSKNLSTSPLSGKVSHQPAHIVATTVKKNSHKLDSASFIAIISGCCVASLAGIGLAGYCWLRLRQETNDVIKSSDFSTSKKPQPDLKGAPNPNDKKLAENAEMFHYIHQKKQMQQLNNNSRNEKYDEVNSDCEDDENTVYECPGLAPPGDMKVSNPLFSDSESQYSAKNSDSPSDSGSPPPVYQEEYFPPNYLKE